MAKLTVKDVDLKGKKVLVRVDFNVPPSDFPYFRPSGNHYDDCFGYSGNHKWDHYSAS